MTDHNHAISNATAWMASIHEMVAKYDAANDDGDSDAQDAARQEMEESPLSVQVRDGWRSPGEGRADPEEYEILLSTGGPALRIVGDMGQYCQPVNARLQWQDWGTPWTDHATTMEDDEVLKSFVGVFWFGE